MALNISFVCLALCVYCINQTGSNRFDKVRFLRRYHWIFMEHQLIIELWKVLALFYVVLRLIMQ